MAYYPPGVLLFESEEPKTMLIKGEVPMLVSWTSTGKRVGDANQSLIVDKAGYGVLPGHAINGKILRTVPNTGGAPTPFPNTPAQRTPRQSCWPLCRLRNRA